LILSKLGIHGFSSSQETSILASMLCGEPCLLIGPPGTAKTELVNAIGAALREDSKRLNPDNKDKWFSYQVYDASKINFEDLFGYPDINALKLNPPSVRYISTPSSIWGKELIAFDELNRCAEDRQSNLFEIIRSRKLHGTPTGNLFIFSTMNPFGDQGTIEMSDALVDRHLFYIKLDPFSSLLPSDRKKVIKRVGQVDGLGFRYWGNVEEKFDISNNKINDTLADVGEEIRTLFTSAMQHYKDIQQNMADGFTILIDKVVESFANTFYDSSIKIAKECTISGRRAASILRGLIAVRSLQYAMSSIYCHQIEEIETTLINTIKCAVPIGISGKLDATTLSKANLLVEETVISNWKSIISNKQDKNTDLIQQLINNKNPIKILSALLSDTTNMITRAALINKLLDPELTRNTKDKNDSSFIRKFTVLLNRFYIEFPEFSNSIINLDSISDNSDRTLFEINRLDIILSDHYLPYSEFITSLLNTYQNNTLVYYALVISIEYYSSRVTNQFEAIDSIATMQNFATTLSLKLNQRDKSENNNAAAN
jgi:MoxR-like ATPase